MAKGEQSNPLRPFLRWGPGCLCPTSYKVYNCNTHACARMFAHAWTIQCVRIVYTLFPNFYLLPTWRTYISTFCKPARRRSSPPPYLMNKLADREGVRTLARHRSSPTGYRHENSTAEASQTTTQRMKTKMMKMHPIIIPSLTKANFPAWAAEIRLQAGALGLSKAIEVPKFTADPYWYVL